MKKLLAILFLGRRSPWILSRIARRFVFGEIDRKANCPACGIVAVHEIKWDEARAVIVHVCKRCGVPWGQSPVVPVVKWRAPAQEQVRVNAVQEYGNDAGNHNEPTKRLPTVM